MTSKQAYPCFKCRDNGFPNTMVYLGGKDDSGKTIYLEEDGIGHVHKTKTNGQQQQPNATTAAAKEDTSNTNALLKLILAELQRLIKLFEEQQRQQQSTDNFSKDRNLINNR